MIEAVSLDQLRIFIAVIEAGSFSAAARSIGRAQSVVSQTVANLEAQLSVRLFDRSGRYPVLTTEGAALATDARQVLFDLDRLKSKAKGIARGQEAELGLVVDVMFPIDRLTSEISRLHATFPTTSLRLSIEALGAVVQPVLDRMANVAILATLPDRRPELQVERIGTIQLVAVAAPDHPLAQIADRVTRADIARHIQLILTDRSPLTQGREFGVLSVERWKLADLGAKHALLRKGLGWGAMPTWLVEDDIRRGLLKALRLVGEPPAVELPVYAVHRVDSPLGPVGRSLIDGLKRGGKPDD